jgi:hypothetical protein
MILRGLWQLASGKRPGITEFGGTIEAFYASIAPLIAFPLVGAGVTALHGDWRLALISLLSRVCAVLALPLVVYETARLLGREKLWLRTATALNWAFWIVLPVFMLVVLLFATLAQTGLDQNSAFGISFGLAALYMLWNRWFILRAGLGLGGWQAVLVVVVAGIAVGSCTLLPLAFGFWPDNVQLSSL